MKLRGESNSGENVKLSSYDKKLFWMYLSTIFLILCTSLLILFDHEKKETWQDTENLLKSVNTIKIKQIAAWHQDELTDVTSISNNSYLKDVIAKYLSEQTTENECELKTALQQVNDEHDYLQTTIYDTKGKLLTSSNYAVRIDSDILTNTIKQSLEAKDGFSSDFYQNIGTNKVLIDFTTPVYNAKNEPVAVLVFTQLAGDVILSTIETWPLISESGETMVIKKHGDKLILLSHSRVNDVLSFDSIVPSELKIKLLLNKSSLIDNLIRFKDYRGKEVLGYVSEIEGKSWFLVSKVDTAEIYGRLKYKLLLISGTSLLIFLLLVLGLVSFYNKRQKNAYQTLYFNKVKLLKAQNLIVENEKILSSIYNAVAEVILTIDLPERIITHTNSAVEQVFGWKPSEVIGKSTAILFSEKEEWEKSTETMLNAIKNKQIFCHAERKLYNKNKQPIYCEIHTSFIYLDDKIIKAVSVYHDITEKKQLIDELTQARIMAENKEKLKSMFLADIAHEVRSPLNGIMGFTELLMTSNITPDKQQHYLEILKKTGERMSGTINDIMELSRIEAGATELKISNVDIDKMTDYFINFFKPEAEEKGLEFRLNNKLKNTDFLLKTDQGKLESIVSNLLKNAIKYTLQGFVELEVKIDDSNLVFVVRDSGLGISPEKKEEIFNRFVQVERTQAGRYDGLGIGLSIVKSYAEMIGGSISLESVEGEGSVFYFIMPVDGFSHSPISHPF